MELMEEISSLEKRIFRNATEKRIPIYGVLELTPLCNMHCDMCYVRLNREEMEALGRLLTLEEWIHIAEQMKEKGTLFVLLTGGEPLLYPSFKELYLKLREMGMIVTVNTNGTMLDDEWITFFCEHKPRRINITLYGASEETYKNLCHFSGGFSKAVEAVRKLRKCDIAVKLAGSLTKVNVDERMDIVRIGEELDVPVRIDSYMYPRIRERSKAYNEQVRLNPEQAADAEVDVLRQEMGEELFAAYVRQKLHEVDCVKEYHCDNKMSCKAGKSSLVINWQGKMMPCVMLDNLNISLLETDFDTAWEMVVNKTEELCVSEQCGSCEYKKVCEICPANAVAETGKYDAVPEYLCRYTKRTVEHYRRYQEEKEKRK